MIAHLASWPRSGNSMLRLLIWQVFEKQTFPAVDERALISVLGTDTGLRLSGKDDPDFAKTHKPPSDDKPAIFIVRDGRDAIVSFYHYIHTVTHHPASMRQVICDPAPTGTPSPGNWSDFFHAWQPLTRDDRILVKYEEMLEEPDTVIDRVAIAFNLKPQRRFVNNFPALQSRITHGVFRTGKNGGWQGRLVGTDLKLFWEVHGDVMEQLGYGRKDDGRTTGKHPRSDETGTHAARGTLDGRRLPS
ncbi:hypothetical protein LCGC14_0297440 [marine sediment metagenome]|uniref:Sulfotransferase domain-containing protein n=1 Tax=marine sediment metagenome TaxID=412755 RepID=A0A0F9WCF5_9ZZZZ